MLHNVQSLNIETCDLFIAALHLVLSEMNNHSKCFCPVYQSKLNLVIYRLVFMVSFLDGDSLCQNISEFLCSNLAVSLAQKGSCLFILCCLEGLATLAEKIPSLTRYRKKNKINQ